MTKYLETLSFVITRFLCQIISYSVTSSLEQVIFLVGSQLLTSNFGWRDNRGSTTFCCYLCLHHVKSHSKEGAKRLSNQPIASGEFDLKKKQTHFFNLYAKIHHIKEENIIFTVRDSSSFCRDPIHTPLGQLVYSDEHFYQFGRVCILMQQKADRAFHQSDWINPPNIGAWLVSEIYP